MPRHTNPASKKCRTRKHRKRRGRNGESWKALNKQEQK